MRHTLSHKAAWFPGRDSVAGVALSPMTLGHLRLLEVVESPWLHGQRGTIADLAATLTLLRLPWRVSRWLIPRRRLLMLLAAPLIACLLRRPERFEEHAVALVRYLSDCQDCPDAFVEATPDGRLPDPVAGVFASSPALRIAWRLAAVDLRQVSRSPVRQVWDISVLEAIMWCVTAAEISGAHFESRADLDKLAAPDPANIIPFHNPDEVQS